MTVLSDIKRMQIEGKTDQEIIGALKQQGISPREITEALTQSKIREAVVAPGAGDEAQAPMPGQEALSPQEMTPSINDGSQGAPEAAAYAQDETQQPQPYPPQEQQYPQEAQQPYPQEGYPPQEQQGYPQEYPQYQQQPQMGGISPDTITEISEQVVAEKLAPIREDIEKVIDMKTTVESKLDYLDERLKRIEKIIDRLQLSIMQKVGDYMTNIDDIKKEIVETQKSFKSMS